MLRYLFRFSFAFAVVVALLALVAFFLPRRHAVERTVTVAAPPAAVFPLVGDLARWKDWGVWYVRDPQLVVKLSPATTGAGAWTVLENSGGASRASRVEVVESVAPELVRYRNSYASQPLVLEGTIRLVAAAGGTQTVVTWRDEADMGWSPVTRWFGLLLEGLRAKEIEPSLAKLKAVAESKR